MGRSKAKIDWKKVDNLLKAQCDGVAIAGIIGIHPNTLYLACEEKFKIGFSEYSATKRSEGQELLRAKQYQTAMEGDKTMLVWLGKQYLGQKEKQDVTTNGKDVGGTQLIFANTPLSQEDIEEIKRIQNGGEETSTDAGISET
jgi:hypothetical protein